MYEEYLLNVRRFSKAAFNWELFMIDTLKRLFATEKAPSSRSISTSQSTGVVWLQGNELSTRTKAPAPAPIASRLQLPANRGPSLIAQYKSLKRQQGVSDLGLEGLEIAVWEAFQRILQTPVFAVTSTSATPSRSYRILYLNTDPVLIQLREYIPMPAGRPLGSDKKSVDRIILKSIENALSSVLIKKGWLVRLALPGAAPSNFWTIAQDSITINRALIINPPLTHPVPELVIADVRVVKPSF